MRFTARLLFAATALLLAGAAAAWLWPARPAGEPPMAVEPLAADLGDVPAGTRAVTFTIANPADRPRRVIGLAEG